jgi:DNA-binding NarL/FixJ family response regulator
VFWFRSPSPDFGTWALAESCLPCLCFTKSKKMPTILIYEDNKALRDGICSLLRLAANNEVLGAFADCSLVENQVTAFNPDLILMDIDMPGINGIEAVKKIRTFNKVVQIIMLTVFDDDEHVFKALQGGANGYLLKKHISDKLIDAIKEILGGGAPMSPEIARMIVNNMQNQQKTPGNYKLTAREKEILLLLSSGNSYKMIGNVLNLSIETIRTHAKHVYEKLHVSSQLEAVSKAFNERLV